METNYIYSVSKVKVLEQSLPRLSDYERLLSTDNEDSFLLAIKETGLNFDYSQIKKRSELLPALENIIISAKNLLQKISPEKTPLQILWLSHDIHNLRLMARAIRTDLEWEDIKKLTSEAGIYDPRYVWQKVQAKRLDDLFFAQVQNVFKRAEDIGLDKLDELFDSLYFDIGQSFIEKTKDRFLKNYWLSFVNLHNLIGHLRWLENKSVNFSLKLITKTGVLRVDKLNSSEEVLQEFIKFGGENFWREAIEYYQTGRGTTKINIKMREYCLWLAKKQASDMFSSASLVLYYLKCLQAIDNLRMITIGKNSGMDLSEIKSNLQTMYVSK